MPTPDKKPWWRSRQQISIRYDLSIKENIDAYIAFFAEVESTTRAEAMRECAEIVKNSKCTEPHYVGSTGYFIKEGINKACESIALSIESRIKE